MGLTASLSSVQWDLPLAEFEPLPSDALAKSCANYRLWQENNSIRWRQYDDIVLCNQDLDLANKILEYYRHRFLVKKIRGHDLTVFQSELYQICNGSTWYPKHSGMIYRLPWFFHEDCTRDQIEVWYSKHGDSTHAKNHRCHDLSRFCLRPFAKTLKSRRTQELWEYWWYTDEPSLACLKVDSRNNLLGIIDSQFETGKEFNLMSYPNAELTMPGKNHYFWHLGMIKLA